MNKWIEERRAKEMTNAMASAVKSYNKIERNALILEKVEAVLAEFDGSLETILAKNWNLYTDSNQMQIYTWRTTDDAKAECETLLIAMVEGFGEGKRSKSGNDINYEWKNAIGDTNLVLQMPPATTGCKLVEKKVYVPAQKATTRIEYEIACIEEVVVAD